MLYSDNIALEQEQMNKYFRNQLMRNSIEAALEVYEEKKSINAAIRSFFLSKGYKPGDPVIPMEPGDLKKLFRGCKNKDDLRASICGFYSIYHEYQCEMQGKYNPFGNIYGPF